VGRPAPTAAPSGYLLVFAAAVLWGILGLFARGALDAGLSALEIAFWRALLAGAAFGAHAALAGRLRVRRGADALALGGFALIGVTLFYGSLTLAIEAGGISLAFILLYTAPAFVAVLAWPLLGERLTAVKGLLVALAIAGVALVASTGAGASGVRVTPTSLGWGLTAGLSYASYYLFGKWVLRALRARHHLRRDPAHRRAGPRAVRAVRAQGRRDLAPPRRPGAGVDVPGVPALLHRAAQCGGVTRGAGRHRRAGGGRGAGGGRVR
jgi:drug/metabolite transporter (DMT)-like permease